MFFSDIVAPVFISVPVPVETIRTQDCLSIASDLVQLAQFKPLHLTPTQLRDVYGVVSSILCEIPMPPNDSIGADFFALFQEGLISNAAPS
jgi:hypothetical protein